MTESWETESGVHLGDPLLGARVVAVVTDAPDLYGDIIVSPALVPEKLRDTAPESWFVDPGGADLSAPLDGTDARVLTADAWIDEVDQQTRAANNLGLWVLLGPAGLYAAIAIVNSVLVGASQRRAQLRTIALLGRPGSNCAGWPFGRRGWWARRPCWSAAWSSSSWAGPSRSATSADVADQPLTLPLLPLAAIVATCAALTLVAALVGSRRAVR